jgi:hypothetical protein
MTTPDGWHDEAKRLGRMNALNRPVPCECPECLCGKPSYGNQVCPSCMGGEHRPDNRTD